MIIFIIGLVFLIVGMFILASAMNDPVGSPSPFPTLFFGGIGIFLILGSIVEFLVKFFGG